MKLGLVGYGYWGKILHKNLKDYNVVVYDITNPDTSSYEDILKCSHVFVAVNTANHYSVCKNLLEHKINVFCEKPLTFTLEQSKDLFSIAEKNNCNLFVDWLFTYNEEVNEIKNIITSKKLGNLQHISMNRLNKGPVRIDVNSFYDLASHDLSILIYLLNPTKITKELSYSFRTNKLSQQQDSFFGVYLFDSVKTIINTSWEHPVKNRDCYFVFNEGTVYWNDINQELYIGSERQFLSKTKQPLKASIDSFINNNTNKELTLKVMSILDEN